ncbi:hypothetical protein AB0J81_13760 [Streptomyces bobili]|uniref:hypothetical protein n=1 Tax=Streptomyces bobili TaxID=67280 RepID=UPI003447E614
MSACKKCGREPENGTETHWLGCEEIAKRFGPREGVRAFVEKVLDNHGILCEHDGCKQPKKEWSGKGAKPKYCATGHKKEK